MSPGLYRRSWLRSRADPRAVRHHTRAGNAREVPSR
jgi:hypothetical protein